MPSISVPKIHTYLPLVVETSEIRLLELMPGSLDDPIKCQLRTSSLQSHPTYEAVSYVWGNAKDTRLIYVNGHEAQVTRNLGAALCELRDSSDIRTLWVDALCINQSDPVERGQQVEKMHSIYSQASNVISWLGEASEDSGEALEVISELGSFLRGADVDFDDLISGEKSMSSQLSNLGFPIATKNWEAVWNLFEREYWSRVWIIQELVSRGSKEPLKPSGIYCGDKKIDKADYDDACYCLMLMQHAGSSINRETGEYDGPIARLLQKGRSTSPALIMWQTLAYCDGTWDLGPWQQSLPRLLDFTRQFGATDELDKVYALLGMVSESQRLVRPDYTISTRTMLMNFVKAFVDAEGKLNAILSSRSEICAAGPSWTPEIHSNHHAGDSWRPPTLNKEFKASGDTKPDVKFDQLKGLMSAKGVVIGKITRLIGPQEGGEAISNGYDNITQLLTEVGHVDIYRELKEFANGLNSTSYDVFWRTLILDQDDSSSLERRSRVYFGLESVPADFDPELGELAREINYVLPYSQKMIALMNRTLIETAKGNVGLGPYCAKVGDIVTVLYGCDRCVVLRPITSGYQVVGDAYIYGAMRGEFVEGRDLDEQVFDLY